MSQNQPVYTEQQADFIEALATVKAELKASREQQERDNALLRDEMSQIREDMNRNNAALLAHLDKLNDANVAHSAWIAGHDKECIAQESRLKDIEYTVETHESTLKMVKGGWKAAVLVSSILVGLAVFAYHVTHIISTVFAHSGKN